jgi:hypothetical protein
MNKFTFLMKTNCYQRKSMRYLDKKNATQEKEGREVGRGGVVFLVTLKTWGKVLLIGLLTSGCAFAFLLILSNSWGGIAGSVAPYVISAPIAFGFNSMLYWWVFLFRTDQQLTMKRGALAGLLSSFFAHPLMWYLLFLWSSLTTGMHSNPDPLTALGASFVMFAFEVVFGWWLWLITLFVGMIVGMGIAGLLLLSEKGTGRERATTSIP